MLIFPLLTINILLSRQNGKEKGAVPNRAWHPAVAESETRSFRKNIGVTPYYRVLLRT
jgi:hypothetical protein